MSEEILSAVRDGLASIDAKVKSRIDTLEDSITEISQKSSRHLGSGRSNHSPLSKITSDPAVQALRNGRVKSAMVQITASLPSLLAKSTLVGDEASSETDLFSTPAQRAPGIYNDARRPLRLLDIMQRLPVTGSSFEFTSLDGYAAAADYQATEGAEKAEQALPTEVKTANISTIACWIEVTKQILADAPSLNNALGGLLAFGVASKLEHELINGVGGTGEIAGLTSAGNFTSLTLAGTDTLPDAVSKAIASLAVNGWNATACLVHPETWREARVERADSGTGMYVAGSWSNPSRPSIWGVDVLTSPSVSQNDVIVIDGSQTLLLDRQAITVEMGRIQSQFVRNCETLLSEGRFGLAVLSPSAVMYGTLSS